MVQFLTSFLVELQRHCRLKHNGNIQVIENRVTDDDGPELSREVGGDESSGMLFVNEKPTGKKASHKNNRDSPAPLVEEDSMGKTPALFN